MAASTAAIAQDTRLPAPLVYLRDVDATIVQDMRYATASNFTGRVVPGYEAPECILASVAAQALARVQHDLQARQLSLKVYDCYRPRRAVVALTAWARDPRETPETKRYHPRIPKPQLMSHGYIAGHSEHSRGIAVDLTLMSATAPSPRARDEVLVYGDCHAPRPQPAPDGSLDMGTDYDCFDLSSHTRAPGLSPAQREARRTLVESMAWHGFRNYSREWWHYRFAGAADGPSFDVPVRSRPLSSRPERVR